MASSPKTILDSREELVSAYCACVTTGLNGNNYLEILLIRDRIQLLLAQQFLSIDETKRVWKTDAFFKAQAAKLHHSVEIEKLSLRHTVLPAKEQWWWRSSEEPLLWNVVSILVLVLTAGFATDFCARILSRNPDAWGVSAVILQSALALIAGGTFTSAGKKILSRTGLSHIAARIRACLAVVLCLIVLSLWYFVPTALSNHYNRLGLQACPSNLECPTLPVAVTMFQRASSLNPANSDVHYNFGRAYELAYDYDRAIQQYQEAVLNHPESPLALNNWARLLLIQKKDTALALRLLDDAISQAKAEWKPPDYFPFAASIYKNRGLANYQAGYFEMAKADLACSLRLYRELSEKHLMPGFCDPSQGLKPGSQPELAQTNAADPAAPHCLLAMVETSLKDTVAAQNEAQQCVDLTDRKPTAGTAPKIEADSIRFSRSLVQQRAPREEGMHD